MTYYANVKQPTKLLNEFEEIETNKNKNNKTMEENIRRIQQEDMNNKIKLLEQKQNAKLSNIESLKQNPLMKLARAGTKARMDEKRFNHNNKDTGDKTTKIDSGLDDMLKNQFLYDLRFQSRKQNFGLKDPFYNEFNRNKGKNIIELGDETGLIYNEENLFVDGKKKNPLRDLLNMDDLLDIVDENNGPSDLLINKFSPMTNELTEPEKFETNQSTNFNNININDVDTNQEELNIENEENQALKEDENKIDYGEYEPDNFFKGLNLNEETDKLLEKQRLNENANKVYGNQSIDNNQMLPIQSETTGNKSSESKSLTDFNKNQLNITSNEALNEKLPDIEGDENDDNNKNEDDKDDENIDFTENLNPTKTVMIEHMLEKTDTYNDLYKKYKSGNLIMYDNHPMLEDNYYEYSNNELIALIDNREGQNEAENLIIEAEKINKDKNLPTARAKAIHINNIITDSIKYYLLSKPNLYSEYVIKTNKGVYQIKKEYRHRDKMIDAIKDTEGESGITTLISMSNAKLKQKPGRKTKIEKEIIRQLDFNEK